MDTPNLDVWVQQQSNIVDKLRAQGGSYKNNFPVVPNEYTNWIDEARAIVETCALADLSHHMTAVRLQGPDTIQFLKELCVNDFDNFEIGQAKQIIMCNHEGHIMGDGPLLRLGDEEFYGPGIHATKWLRFKLETGEYDVEAKIEPPTPLLDGDPEKFVFQVQGPNSYDVLEQLTDANLRDIGFYRFEEIDLAGVDVHALGHGMSPESGFEFHGPFERAEDVRDALTEAGEEYGLHQLGSRTYVSNSVRVGWVPPFIKPVYDIEEMKPYRQWVTEEKERTYGKTWTETLESSFSIEGSFESETIRDYYLTPIELGYEKLIDFDHDFVGKEALQREAEAPDRTLVSLMWDREDTHKIQNSIFEQGDNYKYMDDLPRLGWARGSYDAVRNDGELVGISLSRSLQWDVRKIVSLCSIDVEYSDPGTEVTLVWGEPGGTSLNPTIEDHAQTEITATVEPAPYTADKRRSE